MTTGTERKRLPEGMQSFERIRKGDYLYVDKTDFVWQLANTGATSCYLSRPRRFGKSLLIDTLQCYLEGRKELFEGLKIMQMEKNWVQHPVIHLDMSGAGATVRSLESYLDNIFGKYEKTYAITPLPTASFATRLNNIIEGAYERSGQLVAILIDEYDAPLQHSWHTAEYEACTALYREVFAILKSAGQYEKLVFITGITKFTQISLFSVLNNLTNISFFPEYAAMCGFTKEEILSNFRPEMERMAGKYGWTMEETLKRLVEHYDGYHFSDGNMVDVFNPYSLINALAQSKLGNYWASSGATSLLPKFVDDIELKIKDFEQCYIDRDTLESSDVTGGGAELFLYQSGYLTMKGYDEDGYVLGIPNQEVRKALYKIVIPALTLHGQGYVISAQSNLLRQMNNARLSDAMKTLKALIADVPYSNKKLASMDMEERYRFIISSIFYAIGLRVEVERMMSKGRIDLVVWTLHYIYVIELKLTKNGGLQAAGKQIRENLYVEPFKAENKEVVALAIELDDQGKGLVDYCRI